MNISKLNIYSQKLKIKSPHYENLQKMGLYHNPIFQISCTFCNMYEIGEGKSLKQAKENAAEKMINILKIDDQIKKMEDDIVYSVVSYNIPILNLWNNTDSQYILTLKKKNNDIEEFKNLRIKIVEDC